MSDSTEISYDNAETWQPIELAVTGRIVDGDSITGVNFASDDETLAQYVDSSQQLVLLIPDISDDPLVGQLRRQGPDYLLIVNTN